MGNSNKKSVPCAAEKEEFSSILFVDQETKSLSMFFHESPTKNIGSLSLNHCHLGPEGAKMITRNLWPNLTNLKFHESRLGNAGVSHLIKIKSPNLRILNLVGNGINDEGFGHLKRGNWKLKYLTINQKYGVQKRPNKMTVEGRKSIIEMQIQKKWEVSKTEEYNYSIQILNDPDFI